MTSVFTSLPTMLRKLMLLLAVAGFSATALSGCNTVEGAGQDLESAGEAVEDTAD